jgi:hypothetical protein
LFYPYFLLLGWYEQHSKGGTQWQGGNSSAYTPQDDPTSSQCTNDVDRGNYDEDAELERWFGQRISRILDA